MSLALFFQSGHAYWCKDWRGKVELALCEGVNEQARTVRLRAVDGSSCGWPLDQVTSGMIENLFPRRDRSDDREIRDLLDQWLDGRDDHVIDRTQAFRQHVAAAAEADLFAPPPELLAILAPVTCEVL